ncbi:unnamed protein product [Bathycoccus prasinos]
MFSSPFAMAMTQSSSFSLMKAPASFCNAKQQKQKHQRKEMKRNFCVPVSSTILVKENDDETSKPTTTRRRDAVLLASSAVFYALPSFAFGGGKKEEKPDPTAAKNAKKAAILAAARAKAEGQAAKQQAISQEESEAPKKELQSAAFFDASNSGAGVRGGGADASNTYEVVKEAEPAAPAPSEPAATTPPEAPAEAEESGGFSLPSVSLPSVSLPSVSLPSVSLPKLPPFMAQLILDTKSHRGRRRGQPRRVFIPLLSLVLVILYANYRVFDVLTQIESSPPTAKAKGKTDLEIDENSKTETNGENTEDSMMTMPAIGFGTAGLGLETKESVKKALQVGYRMIDTAQAPEWYREDLVGLAMEESINVVKRKDVFVTTKIHPRHLGRKGMDMIETSLTNLRTTYVDLVLLHYSECWGNLCSRGEVVPGTWKEAYRELERLVVEFKVARFIGVSNFNANALEELHAFANVQPLVVQMRSDVFAQDRRTMDVCAKYGWRFEAYSSLGGQWWQYKTNPVLNNDVVKTIAARYNVSPALVVLNYAKNVLHQTIIPRSRDWKHMEDSLLRLDSFELDDEEIESLKALDGKVPSKD